MLVTTQSVVTRARRERHKVNAGNALAAAGCIPGGP